MAIPCPFNGCDWAIPEGTDPGLAPVLLTTHALNNRTNPRAKPKRPEFLTSGGTTEAWTYFLQRWRSYVTSVQLAGQDLTIQLLECCDSNLRRNVTRNVVNPLPIEGMTEKELLAAIKSLAVTAENTKVARVTLSRMTQERTEPTRAFAARLRGQAEVCRFLKKCPDCDGIMDQGEERVADQLCIGLADAEIQEDLLKHPDQDLCVEDTIRFIEVRAAGKKSAMTMSTPNNAHALDDHSAEAVTSQYRRKQRPLPPRNHPGCEATLHLANNRSPDPRQHNDQDRAPTAASAGMASKRRLPTVGSIARLSAAPAHHVAGSTTQPQYAGRERNTSPPSPNWLKECQKVPYSTKHGRVTPHPGCNSALPRNP